MLSSVGLSAPNLRIRPIAISEGLVISCLETSVSRGSLEEGGVPPRSLGLY